MLVLSRKKGQELVIGDDIRIVINRVAGNRVTIGIAAPEQVSVVRGELQETVNSFRDDRPPGRSGRAPGPSIPATAK